MRRWELKSALRLPAVRAVVALVFVFLFGMIFNQNGTFFEWGTHRDLLRQVAVYGILSCGLSLVILAGGIDLAVGSVLAMVAVTFAILSIHWRWSPAWVIPICLLVGTGLGALSGALIARFRMQPFIATLAMMVFARGLAKWVSSSQKISTAIQGADGNYQYIELPPVFSMIDKRVFGDNVAIVTLIFIACLAVCWWILNRWVLGRHLLAIGGNEEAARLSGIPVGLTKVLVYALCGFFAGVAGICQVAQEQQGDPEAGQAYELTAIAMVVMGGNSLLGGRGGMGLTLLGVLTIGYLEKILSINAVGEPSRLMLTGMIIVSAVLLQKRGNTG